MRKHSSSVSISGSWRCGVIAGLQVLAVVVVLVVAASWQNGGQELLVPMGASTFFKAMVPLWGLLLGTNALYHKWREVVVNKHAVETARRGAVMDTLALVRESAERCGYRVQIDPVGGVEAIEQSAQLESNDMREE